MVDQRRVNGFDIKSSPRTRQISASWLINAAPLYVGRCFNHVVGVKDGSEPVSHGVLVIDVTSGGRRANTAEYMPVIKPNMALCSHL